MTTAIESPSLVGVFTYMGVLWEDVPKDRPWLKGEWAWATNGRFMVAVRGYDGATYDTPSDYAKVDRYLSDPLRDGVPGSMASLLAFAGDVRSVDEAEEDCDRCDGSGYEDFETCICEHCGDETRIQCDSCEGTGRQYVEPPKDYAKVGSVAIDRPLLAYALRVVPTCETVMVGTVPAGSELALAIDGDGWRVVLMCVRDASNTPTWTPDRAA